MFCRSCGKEILDTASFCPHCGAATQFRAAPSPQPQPFPTAPPPRRRLKWIAIGAAVLIIAIVGIATFAFLSFVNQPVILMSEGTVEPLAPQEIVYQQFEVYRTARITGSFTSNNGVTEYILTPSQFSTFSTTTGPATAYVHTSGRVFSGSMNLNMSPGTYYLVFWNDNDSVSTSVTITQSIALLL